MNKIIKYLMSVLTISILLLGAENVFASTALENYSVTIWSADDMEVGATVGTNGLEFLQPAESSVTKVQVTDKGRFPYSNAIKTGGSASMLNAYVPKTRALKFTVTKPCNMVIYAYGSSDSNVTMKISNSTKIINTFSLEHSRLNRYVLYLDSAGTYYVYGNGSMGICEIAVGYTKGDADIDFDLDWNDIRIFRKVFFDNLAVDEIVTRNIDYNNSGFIDAGDLASMQEYMTDRNKAVFVDNATWNANDMTAEDIPIYRGLELVYKDCDSSNGSIYVKSINEKTYTGENGEFKTYTKCIQTDGDTGEGIGNYPVTKAVKFNLATDAYVTVYMSTGSSKNIQHKAQIINADGVKVEEFNINNKIGRYTTKLSGNETYFITSYTGTLRIFEINVVSNTNNECKKTININAGATYKLYLTVDKGVMIGKLPVKLTYNASALTVQSMGGSSGVNVGRCNDRTRIIETGTDYIIFEPYDWADGESGILTEVLIKAKTTGTTTLTLSIEGE